MTLGQATPDPQNAEAWGAYIAALRGSLQTSWARARTAYLTLKKVRADLGYPFMLSGFPEGGVGADNGAWDTSLEGNIQDLQAMVKVMDDAFGDVLAQKRKLFYVAASNDWAMEGLPGDLLRVKLNAQNQLSLVDGQGQNIHVTGTIGLAPLIVVAGVAAVAVSGAVAFAGAAYAIVKTVDAIASIAEQKTMQTAINRQAELVQSGAATAEEAAALTKSVFDGAAAVNVSKAKLEEAKNKPNTDGFGDTIKTIAYVGLGIGVVYLIAKLIPEGGLKRSGARA